MEVETFTNVWVIPWVIENGETTICCSCMSCSSKQPQVHAITWQHWWRHYRLWSTSMPNAKKQLILFIPVEEKCTWITLITEYHIITNEINYAQHHIIKPRLKNKLDRRNKKHHSIKAWKPYGPHNKWEDHASIATQLRTLGSKYKLIKILTCQNNDVSLNFSEWSNEIQITCFFSETSQSTT